MKKNALKECWQKSQEEIQKLIREKKESLARFVVEKNSGRLKNLRLGRGLRKEISQLLTILGEKERRHD